MKWIDFDELEERQKDADDAFEEIEDWDGHFFEELKDSYQEEEMDDEDYFAIPQEVLEQADAADDEEDVRENYLQFEVEDEDSSEDAQQNDLKAEEALLQIEHEEKNPYELEPEKAEKITLEEKRAQMGRMLGLRYAKRSGNDAEDASVLAEETAQAENISASDISEGAVEDVTTAEDFPSFDFEQMADQMIEQMKEERAESAQDNEQIESEDASEDKALEQIQEALPEEGVSDSKEEPVYYDPMAYEYEEPEDEDKFARFRESYRKKLAREDDEDDIEPDMPEEEHREDLTQGATTKEADILAESELEDSEDAVLETDAEDTGVESDFIDDDIFEQIERAERARVRRQLEQQETGFVINEDDFEDDEEIEAFGEAEEQEETNEEIKEAEEQEETNEEIKEAEEPEEEFKEVKEAEEQEETNEEIKEAEEPVEEIEEAEDERSNKERVHRHERTVRCPDDKFPEEQQDEGVGVLKKRRLPNPVKKNPELIKTIYAGQNAEAVVDMSKDHVKEQPQLASESRKIDLLKSEFEEEFEDDLFLRTRPERTAVRKDHENRGKKETKKETPDRPIREFLSLMMAIFLVIVLTVMLVEFVGQRTTVNGSSMETTLHDGDNLIVDKISYVFKDPERYDIIVFPYKSKSRNEEVYYIKRIIGLPGEKVKISNGFIYINGERLDESYGKDNELILNPGLAQEEITLGKDEYFVLGDNRNNSSDSREIGNIKKEKIVGRAWIRIYPLDSFGILKHQ